MERLAVTLRITITDSRSIEEHAQDIAIEQSVEIPGECIPDEIHEHGIVGWIESIAPLSESNNQFEVVISFRLENTAFSVPQFLNVVFGNISMKQGYKVVDIDIPASLLESFGGPNYGIDGIRALTGIYKRPLACTAIKPIGLPTEKLAAIAHDYARGGIDLLKEDHAMADLVYHPFSERVPRIQEAICNANASTGGNTLYFPMINGGVEEIDNQVSLVKSLGIKGVLVAPMLIGVDAIRFIAKRYNLAVMAHPAFTGTHFHDPNHGITPAVLLGKIFRLVGTDISIFTNSGGRFPITDADCQQLADALRGPWGDLKPAFPCPAGGMKLDKIDGMARQFGEDTVMLIGGGLMQYSNDLAHSASVFMNAIRQHFGEERRAVAS